MTLRMTLQECMEGAILTVRELGDRFATIKFTRVHPPGLWCRGVPSEIVEIAFVFEPPTEARWREMELQAKAARTALAEASGPADPGEAA